MTTICGESRPTSIGTLHCCLPEEHTCDHNNGVYYWEYVPIGKCRAVSKNSELKTCSLGMGHKGGCLARGGFSLIEPWLISPAIVIGARHLVVPVPKTGSKTSNKTTSSWKNEDWKKYAGFTSPKAY